MGIFTDYAGIPKGLVHAETACSRSEKVINL